MTFDQLLVTLKDFTLAVVIAFAWYQERTERIRRVDQLVDFEQKIINSLIETLARQPARLSNDSEPSSTLKTDKL